MSQLNAVFSHIDDWFKVLHDNQPVTQFNLNGNDAKIRDEETELDALAKDLELLLEDEIPPVKCKPEEEPELYFFSNHPTEELALADPSTGWCCTIECEPTRNINQVGTSYNQYSVVVASHFGGEKVDANQIQYDLKRKIRTPIPRDHEYLARSDPEPKKYARAPMKRFKGIRFASDIRNEVPSVLNTVIMERFARYSERLKVLSQACN